MTKENLIEILENLSDDTKISFSLEGSEKAIKFVDTEAIGDELTIYLEEEEEEE